MQRNKVIYALADAALVVTSDFEKGGTWAGAIEQLEKLHFVPVFVRHGANSGKGNTALLRHGAVPWPDPHDGDELSRALSKVAEDEAAIPKQEALSFALREQSPSYGSMNAGRPSPPLPPNVGQAPSGAIVTPAQALLRSVREILGRELAEPKSEAEVAELLKVSRPQAKAWLARLVLDGVLEKIPKPTRYRVAGTAVCLL
jgi:predicted Rossmann fold nucleotide-binding protein DprA/Smf involved in DNA uptake